MKTIEQAAREYADRYQGIRRNEAFDAFNAGADFALAIQWVSVEDRLPEDEELVLINHKAGGITLAVWNERHQCWDDESGDDVMYSNGVTHWMPIPELKTEKNENRI